MAVEHRRSKSLCLPREVVYRIDHPRLPPHYQSQELGKRLQHWEWRRHYFKKMKQFCVSISECPCSHKQSLSAVHVTSTTYLHLAPPGPPKCVTLSVASSQKLTVAFSPPDGEEDSRTVITRYRSELEDHVLLFITAFTFCTVNLVVCIKVRTYK